MKNTTFIITYFENKIKLTISRQYDILFLKGSENMNEKTTTVRITQQTRNVLKKLSKIKKMPMSSIIYNLAENELKNMYQIEEILNEKI